MQISLKFIPKGPGDGLTPKMQQGITWTKAEQDACCHMASLGLQSSVSRGFLSFKPPSKPLGPPFYLTMSSMNPLYWPDPGWVKFQLWYLEVPGLLVTTLQSCLVQCCKEVQYLLQNKMSTWVGHVLSILLQPQREWVCCYKWKQNNSKRYQYIKNVSFKLLFWAK